MDGYELARRIRAEAPNVDLIAVTGYGLPQDIEKAKEAGFRAHVTKPLDFPTVLRIVESRS